jgi:hypothetical protein
LINCNNRNETNKQQQFQNQIRTIILTTASVVFLVIGIILWRNNTQKQKAAAILSQQKGQVENTLQELTSTQSRLIESEREKISAQHEREMHELEARSTSRTDESSFHFQLHELY